MLVNARPRYKRRPRAQPFWVFRGEVQSRQGADTVATAIEAPLHSLFAMERSTGERDNSPHLWKIAHGPLWTIPLWETRWWAERRRLTCWEPALELPS